MGFMYASISIPFLGDLEMDAFADAILGNKARPITFVFNEMQMQPKSRAGRGQQSELAILHEYDIMDMF
jgi:hypothetical protein